MNRTRRTLGIGAFVLLVVLGTGWAFEKATSSNAHTRGGATVSEPAKGPEPMDTPAATDSGPEYDRSDLLLMQG